uniref:cytoplasmic polyadenylation element-binding protein 1-like isoform X3 n=1 Tax=Myxine glutinosa TaxID=7769 RepID=UPI00358E7F84
MRGVRRLHGAENACSFGSSQHNLWQVTPGDNSEAAATTAMFHQLGGLLSGTSGERPGERGGATPGGLESLGGLGLSELCGLGTVKAPGLCTNVSNQEIDWQDSLEKVFPPPGPQTSFAGLAEPVEAYSPLEAFSSSWRGGPNHELNLPSRDALSGLDPIEAIHGLAPFNRTLFPGTNTPSQASMEHLASAFGDCVNTGMADLRVTSSAADQLGALLASGSPTTMSGGPEQFGSMLGPSARMELGTMMGGGQGGSSAGIEQLGTMLAKMSVMEGRTRADSRSTSPADSDTSGFSSGSEAFGDLMSGFHVPHSLYSPALFSPLAAASRELLLSQMLAARASQAREGACSLGFGPGGALGVGAGHTLERAWSPWGLISPQPPPQLAEHSSIEKQAQLHRHAAAMSEASCTWSGQLPPRIYKNPVFSPKVFLGGVPWDITEAGLLGAFRAFGPVSVEWPGKEGKHPRFPPKGMVPKGYVYLLFESETGVRALLQACTHDLAGGDGSADYFYTVSSRRMRSKEVQVIPWVQADSNFVRGPSERLEPGRTVFVGALHGMLTAGGLAAVLNDLFGGVVYAGIDTDKHRYPIGSGRVTFGNHKSYMKAVTAAFVEIKTAKFTKKVQIDPYLEDSVCQLCCSQPGAFFCREMICFKYFCKSCWHWQHAVESLRFHRPLMRNQKGQEL